MSVVNRSSASVYGADFLQSLPESIRLSDQEEQTAMLGAVAFWYAIFRQGSCTAARFLKQAHAIVKNAPQRWRHELLGFLYEEADKRPQEDGSKTDALDQLVVALVKDAIHEGEATSIDGDAGKAFVTAARRLEKSGIRRISASTVRDIYYKHRDWSSVELRGAQLLPANWVKLYFS